MDWIAVLCRHLWQARFVVSTVPSHGVLGHADFNVISNMPAQHLPLGSFDAAALEVTKKVISSNIIDFSPDDLDDRRNRVAATVQRFVLLVLQMLEAP